MQQIDPAQDGSTIEVQVPSGECFEVENGSLVVLDEIDGRRIAVFAPGTWLSAQLGD